MKHLYNGSKYGVFKDHNGKITTGPKLLKTMGHKSNNLIFGLTFNQIDKMQQEINNA